MPGFDTHLVQFMLTLAFSFLIGLEVKTYQQHFGKAVRDDFFGTTRTLTFTGLLGYVFYSIEPNYLVLYIAGLMSYTLLFALFYYQKLREGQHSILLYLLYLIVYSFGPMLILFPPWFAALLFVIVIFVLNAKGVIQRFSEHTDTIEFETMGKMVLLSGVILPILPDHSINHLVPLSPFKIWMAVVIISGISYAGYIVQKYLFPNRGYYLTGLIGGIYSSTATTVVLAKKMAIYEERVLDAGIIAATAMMYLRLIIVAAIFNLTIAKEILIPFCVFSGLGFIVSLLFLQAKENDMESAILVDANPLELGTAFLFAVLFVVMMSVTTYVTQTYGLQGLKILSFITGLSDIDPFVLSLLTGEYGVTQDQIVAAILIAAGSNNLLKGVYALWFGGIRKSFRSALVVSLLGAGTIAWAFWI